MTLPASHLAVARDHRRDAFRLIHGWDPLPRGSLTGYPRANYRSMIGCLRAFNLQSPKVLP